MKTAKKQPVKSAARSLSKTAAPKSIEEYCGRIPKSSREQFERLYTAIRSVMPADAVEVISYGVPAFRRKRVLVWFAAFAKHCSLFPSARIIEDFKDELDGFTISKGTVQFPLDKPLPAALIKKLVKARITQDEARKPA
jgi:uncharacterized protein YdhG (YjbR/CyaY superfamily)